MTKRVLHISAFIKMRLKSSDPRAAPFVRFANGKTVVKDALIAAAPRPWLMMRDLMKIHS